MIAAFAPLIKAQILAVKPAEAHVSAGLTRSNAFQIPQTNQHPNVRAIPFSRIICVNRRSVKAPDFDSFLAMADRVLRQNADFLFAHILFFAALRLIFRKLIRKLRK